MITNKEKHLSQPYAELTALFLDTAFAPSASALQLKGEKNPLKITVEPLRSDLLGPKPKVQICRSIEFGYQALLDR